MWDGCSPAGATGCPSCSATVLTGSASLLMGASVSGPDAKPQAASPKRSDGADGDRAVVAAEAEAVGDCPADTRLASLVRHVIEIAVRVGRLVIDGRVNQAALDRQGGRDQLDAARSAEQVADHALG